jgi:hypothetical protein
MLSALIALRRLVAAAWGGALPDFVVIARPGVTLMRALLAVWL